jgi:leucine-rich PPR motif-containing protein
MDFARWVIWRRQGALLQEILEKSCTPDLVSYNTLINGLCKHCGIDEAQQIFHEMPKQGLNSDVVTHNTLRGGLCKVGNLKETIKLYNQLKDSSHVPDMITNSTLMDGLCKEGTPQEVNRPLHEILQKVLHWSCDILH